MRFSIGICCDVNAMCVVSAEAETEIGIVVGNFFHILRQNGRDDASNQNFPSKSTIIFDIDAISTFPASQIRVIIVMNSLVFCFFSLFFFIPNTFLTQCHSHHSQTHTTHSTLQLLLGIVEWCTADHRFTLKSRGQLNSWLHRSRFVGRRCRICFCCCYDWCRCARNDVDGDQVWWVLVCSVIPRAFVYALVQLRVLQHTCVIANYAFVWFAFRSSSRENACVGAIWRHWQSCEQHAKQLRAY